LDSDSVSDADSMNIFLYYQNQVSGSETEDEKSQTTTLKTYSCQ
jgi:hypothetical protein